MDDRTGLIEDNVIGTAGQLYQRIMLRAWHNKSFCALNIFVKALHTRRRIIWNKLAPKFRPKADIEVHSPLGWSVVHGHRRFPRRTPCDSSRPEGQTPDTLGKRFQERRLIFKRLMNRINTNTRKSIPVSACVFEGGVKVCTSEMSTVFQ